MANRMPDEQEMKYAQEILMRAAALGVNMPGPSSGYSPMPTMTSGAMPGGMTDASKRLRSEEESSSSEEDHEFQVLTDVPEKNGPKQLPALPKSAPPVSWSLPEGVDSAEQWGDAICKLQKVKHEEMTYKELADSKKEEHQSYVEWVILHGHTKGPRAADFRQYLLYIGKCKHQHSDIAFPGSTEMRQFRASKPAKK